MFVEKYYNYLNINEGFNIETYTSLIKNEDVSIGIKRFPQGLYVVIITDEKNEEIDSVEAINYLNSKNEKYSLHKIVLSDDEYIHGKEDGIMKLVFNEKKRQTIYCDTGCEALAQIALNINSVMRSDKFKSNNFNGNTITIVLIIINIILFIISAIMSKNIMDIDAIVLLKMGGKFGPLIQNGQVWRLLTCNFLHGGIMHLVFNMYALYSIGSQIEIVYGKLKYLLIYFVAGIGSSILSYYLSPMTLSIGASGAIFGLLGALLIYAIKERGRLQKGAISNLVVVIALNLYIGVTLPNIDNFGHIGGLVVGIIISLVINFINDRKR